MLTALMKLNDERVGKRKIKKVSTNINEVVEKVSSWFEDVAEQKNITLMTTSVEEVVIESDPDKLTQVLVNLVDNAIKYTPEGGQVTVDIEKSCDKGVAIHVIDTGIGIESKFQPLIFERLYRVDTSRRTRGLWTRISIAAAMVDNLWDD